MCIVAEDTVYIYGLLGSNFNLAVWQFLLGLPKYMYTISTTNVGFISNSTQNHQFKILPIAI